MIIAIEFLKANWKGLALGIVIGILGSLLTADKPPKLDIHASQTQSGSIQTVSHVTIKPQPMLPSAPGCPPCPQLPEVTVDCGGKAEGSQGQTVSATVQAIGNKGYFSLAIGGGSTIEPQPVLNAGIIASYKDYSVSYSYGLNGVQSLGAYFTALRF